MNGNAADNFAPIGIRLVLAKWLGLTIVAIVLFIAADLRHYLGLTILDEQGIAIALGCALAVVFLQSKRNTRQQVKAEASSTIGAGSDYVLATIALCSCVWLGIRFQDISASFFEHRTEAFVIGAMVVPLIFETLRRTTGWALVSILAAFLLYGLFGDNIPGPLEARVQGFSNLIAYLVGDNVALLGLPLRIVVTVVVMFMVMGQLLTKSGGAEWFIDITMSLMGRTRGGPAKIAIMASALFGSISGSAVSNVASTGLITIPLMKRGGYSRTSAAAFEAVASTGGQIMPPVMGAAAFLMAEFMEVRYSQVILAALVPAILYYVAVFIIADSEAVRKNMAPVEADEIEPLGRVFAKGWFFIVPFVVLIGALFQFNRTPAEAALGASICLLIVGLKGYKTQKLDLTGVFNSLKSAGQISVNIIVIGAMSGLLIGLIEVTGLSFGLTFVLLEIGQTSLFLLLLLTALVCLILGLGMPTSAIYFLVAVLATPPLIRLGIDPFAAHLFVLYYGLLSMITPPVALAAFTAAYMADAPPMKTALRAMKYGWPAFVLPFVFVMSPELILRGELIDNIRVVFGACLGTWAISTSLNGWTYRQLSYLERITLLFSGVLMMFPSRISGIVWLDILGVAMFVTFLVRNRRLKMQQTSMAI